MQFTMRFHHRAIVRSHIIISRLMLIIVFYHTHMVGAHQPCGVTFPCLYCVQLIFIEFSFILLIHHLAARYNPEEKVVKY